MTNTVSSMHSAFGPDRLLVKLAARPDFSAIEQMPRGAERKRAAWAAITASAEAALPPMTQLANQLTQQGFLTNVSTLVSPAMLVLDVANGKAPSVVAAFRNPSVAAIYDGENGRQLWPAVRQALDGVGTLGAPSWGLDVIPQSRPAAAPDQIPYGVQLIGAPEAWSAGADGHGMVFGSIDTGADASHPAIAKSYRGTQPDGSQQHDYNWMDFAKRPSATPQDYQGHGTHTVGSVAGLAGDTPIGVAPAATWISAYGLTGQPADILRALQWMQAPTRRDGTAPDAGKAPDVVGMSWWTGSPKESLLHESIQNLRAAGIEPVKSAGNQGPDSRTISSPGQFPELFATAAVDRNGRAARFSSRGPAPFPPGSTTPKPDFAAPGVDIVSSLPDGKYGAMSGTSMAQPHLSGAILALLSKFPQLTHGQLEQALAAGALDAGTPGRDDVYGWGIIRLPQAIEAAKAITSKAAKVAA